MEEAAAVNPKLFWWLSVWERLGRLGRRAPRRLRLCESLPLGERRFVAVIEFERSRFLVGGTSASLVLLAKLDSAGSVGHSGGDTEASEGGLD